MNDQPKIFLECPIEVLPEEFFQKSDQGFVPTALFDNEKCDKHDITILDITYCEEDIQSDFTIQGTFSQEQYRFALMKKLGSFSKSEQRDFLDYQRAGLVNPREWLQSLEHLVESYMRISPLDGRHTYWEPRLKHVPELIEKCLIDIDKGQASLIEKINFNLSIEELTLLFRLFEETQLMAKPSKRKDLYTRISQNIETIGKRGAEPLSVKNIKNKYEAATHGTAEARIVASLSKKIRKLLNQLAKNH